MLRPEGPAGAHESGGGSLWPMVSTAATGPTDAMIERELYSFAASDSRILALYLFGSRGRHEETEQSDVDVGVLFRKQESFRDLMLLEDALQRRLGLPVDLIDAGRASAFLALDVIRGERLFCGDPDRCDEFELYVMRRAGDLAPFEKERRQLLLQP